MRALAVTALTALLALGCSRAGQRPLALWVLAEGSERTLESPEKIAQLVARAHELGATDLFVQVHRGGRAWFASRWADATPYQAAKAANGGADPLIESLHDAVAECQEIRPPGFRGR